MAGKITIGELSTKASLNAAPMLAGLKQMDAATRNSATYWDGQMTSFSKKLAKKWSAGSLLSGMAKGVGIAGGFAAASHLAEAISGQWEKAAEMAKFVEDSSARQLATLQDSLKSRRTDREQALVIEREIARLERELAGEKRKTFEFDLMKPGEWAEQFRAWLGDTTQSEAVTKRIWEITEAMQALGKEQEALRRKDKDQNRAADKTAAATMGAAMERRIEAEAELSSIYGVEMDRGKMINQLEKERVLYQQQLADLGPIVAKTNADRAIIEQRLAESTMRLIPLMEREMKLGNDMGHAIATSFEDAIFSGEKLGDVLRSLGKDLMRLIFSEFVTTPMAKSIGPILGGIFGGARAGGGPVTGGTPYMVGERGPELFVPRTSGTVVSNSQTASMGSGVPAMNFVYNIASGVTRAELKPLLDQQRAMMRSEIPNLVRRGGAYRSAFA